ncbi:hypothetical protein N9D31_01990, partial [Oligoflexaceae bacterium]|nr:hypothetical protein [Oligoflexaceae bacterium]
AYALDAAVTIPSGALYILVYTANAGGEMAQGISALAKDIGFCTAADAASATITRGTGYLHDPYTLCNVDQLQAMNDNLDAHYQLGLDIDASETSTWTTGTSGTGFEPIGRCSAAYDCLSAEPEEPFSGTLQGNGFTIDGLFINRTRENVGLFGITTKGAAIENFGLTNADIIGSNRTGGVVGYFDGLTNNVTFQGEVEGGSETGGLVGKAYEAWISNGAVDADITCNLGLCGGAVGNLDNSFIVSTKASGTVVTMFGATGGLVGSSERSSVFFSHVNSAVSMTGTSSQLGGLVGIDALSTYFMSTVSGSVTGGGDDFGGLIGNCFGSSVTMSQSNATIDSLGSSVGGLAGKADDCSFYDSVATGSVSGEEKVGGAFGEAEDFFAQRSIATGPVDARMSTAEAGAFIGFSESDIDNSFATGLFYDDGTLASGAFVGDNDGGIIANSTYNTDATVFYGKTHAVFTTGMPWDFVGGSADGSDEIWFSSAAAIPTIATAIQANGNDLAGNGTKEDPFLIEEAADFELMKKPAMSRSHYKVVNDLDFTGVDLPRLGTEDLPFSGEIDGNGKTISNLTFLDTSVDYVGLISYGLGTVIHNLSIKDSSITAGSWVGSFFGECTGCRLSQLSSSALITAQSLAGGIAGQLNHSVIGLLENSGDVSSENAFVGGIASDIRYSRVAGVKNSAAVSARTSFSGGVFGAVDQSKMIGLQSTGTVTGTYRVGGVIGVMASGTNTAIYSSVEQSFATGSVNGVNEVGGLIGSVLGGMVSNSYSTGAVTSTDDDIGGFIGKLGGTAGQVVSSSYSTSPVSSGSGSNIGSFIGTVLGWGTVTNCFATGAITSTGGTDNTGFYGIKVGGDIVNSIYDATESLFYNPAHATYVGTPAWDYEKIWLAPNNELPKLRSYY